MKKEGEGIFVSYRHVTFSTKQIEIKNTTFKSVLSLFQQWTFFYIYWNLINMYYVEIQRFKQRFRQYCLSCHGQGPCIWHEPMSLKRLKIRPSLHLFILWHFLNSVPGCQPTPMLDKGNSITVLTSACGNAWEWGQI